MTSNNTTMKVTQEISRSLDTNSHLPAKDDIETADDVVEVLKPNNESHSPFRRFAILIGMLTVGAAAVALLFGFGSNQATKVVGSPGIDAGINVNPNKQNDPADVDNLMGCFTATPLVSGTTLSILANHPDPVETEQCFAEDTLFSSYSTLGNWFHVTPSESGTVKVRFSYVAHDWVSRKGVHMDLYQGGTCNELKCRGRSTYRLDQDLVEWEAVWAAVKGESYFLAIHYGEGINLDHFKLQLTEE